jgi:hypothetical protein
MPVSESSTRIPDGGLVQYAQTQSRQLFHPRIIRGSISRSQLPSLQMGRGALLNVLTREIYLLRLDGEQQLELHFFGRERLHFIT